MNEPKSSIYEFAEFHVDAAKRLLMRRNGETIPLTPKVFDTLLYLVEHRGVVLDKDKLMQAIWPRHGCGRKQSQPEHIRTAPRAWRKPGREPLYRDRARTRLPLRC